VIREVTLTDAAAITGKSERTIRRLVTRYSIQTGTFAVGHEKWVDLPDLQRAISRTKVGRPKGSAAYPQHEA